MNLLLINHYAGNPSLGMEYRPYYLAREWVRLEHRVRLVAASYSHVRSHQPKVGNTPRLENYDGIEYLWFPTPSYSGNGVGRAKNIWAFLRQVWAASDALVRDMRPDVIIASSTYPMDIWVARRLALKAGAKLVFEVHDLWPLSPIELSGMSRFHPFIMLCQHAEDTAYRVADVVVSMLPKVHDYMTSRGLDLRKLVIVPNGIALDEWEGEPQPLRDDVAQAIAAARSTGHVVVGYAGSHGLPNALDTLLDAAVLLKNEPIRIVMVGDGHEKQSLAQRVQTEGIANVSMFPPIPKAQIPSLLAAIDIAYIGWQRMPLYRFGIAPNKLMDYMMAGCVVLHSVEAGNDPVTEARCGLTVAPKHPEAVAEGLRTLAAMPILERKAMGDRGRSFVREHHAYSVLAHQFLKAIGE